MTVQYRELAVAVEPAFADELKAQLDARLVRRHGSTNPLPAADQPIRLRGIPEVTRRGARDWNGARAHQPRCRAAG
jgi:hypothetical protein